MNDNHTVIVDGVRSPIGLKNGSMIGLRSDDLTSQTIKALLERNPSINKENIEDIVLGCAFPEGPQGMLMAKGVAILSGLPNTTAGKVVNRFCGSSMDSVHQLSQAIDCGDIQSGIACGAEDMFGVPMGGFSPSFHPELYEKDYYIGMGETAEILAKELSITREEQEQFAINSHKKALSAISKGSFNNEIIPITFNEKTISSDEGPRDPNIEKIKSLDPAFDSEGTITAATSSPISIGSSAILLASDKMVKNSGIKAEFKILSRAIAGVDWRKMGMGPIPATEKALKKANISMEKIDVIELNEAFAAQSLYVIKKAKWDINKVNLNGGAIALGHPLGCSGSRIIVSLMNTMRQQDSQYGLATMCIGSGQGIATIIERIKG